MKLLLMVSGLNVRTAETFHNSQIIQLLDAQGLKFTAAGDPPKESPQMKCPQFAERKKGGKSCPATSKVLYSWVVGGTHCRIYNDPHIAYMSHYAITSSDSPMPKKPKPEAHQFTAQLQSFCPKGSVHQ